MRDRRKRHDSERKQIERQRARRKSVGLSWRKLPGRLLFWPDELDRLGVLLAPGSRERRESRG